MRELKTEAEDKDTTSTRRTEETELQKAERTDVQLNIREDTVTDKRRIKRTQRKR